jgi:hypothetical protein
VGVGQNDEGFEKITVDGVEYTIEIIPFWKWSLFYLMQ